MQDNRSALEDQWRDAFEDAEMAPSEGLWKNIDSQLTQQERGKYRRGFIFYRSLAAACIVCLLVLGYYIVQDSLQHSDSAIGQQTKTTSPAEKKSAPKALRGKDRLSNQKTGEPAEQLPNKTIPKDQTRQLPAFPEDKTNDQQASPALATPSKKPDAKTGSGSKTANTATNANNNPLRVFNAGSETSELPSFITDDTPGFLAALGPANSEPTRPDWTEGMDKLYRVPQPFMEEEEDVSQQQGKLFAGVNLATNYFDPNFSWGGGSAFAANADVIPEAISADRLLTQSTAESYSTQDVSSGLQNRPQLSISYGVDVGMMLTRRLSLESGIDYGQMNSNTSTTLVAEDFNQNQRIPLLVSNAQNVQNSGTRTRFTGREQPLTSTFEIISVPLKIGYNLQFNKLNFNLSSGIAANFFLNNRLSDESGQLSTVNLSANSASSPYRLLYYSAVVSSGLNYLLTQNYAISVAPNYNFALSDLTESGYNFSSQPNNFSIDFGIRYIFQ